MGAGGRKRPAKALAMASWWVSFYLTSMGPLYRQTLLRLEHGRHVEKVLAANPTGRTSDVPEWREPCWTS